MRAGKLQWRVVLQNRAPTTDTEGSPGDDWVTVATIWADVQPLTANELLQAAQAEAQVTHQVNIRYRRDIGHNSRLLFDAGDGFGSRVLDIIAAPIDVGMNHRELQLLCQERQV